MKLNKEDSNESIENLEDIDDIRSYDEAKREDDGERVLFDDYLRSRRIKN